MLPPTFSANNTPSNIENYNIEEKVLAFPNPFNDHLNIIAEDDFYITNLIGQKILDVNKTATLNTKFWDEGIYILHSKSSMFRSLFVLLVYHSKINIYHVLSINHD